MASTLQGHYERNREYFAKFRASVTGLKEFNFETVRAWQQIAEKVKLLLEMENHEGIALDITAEENNPPREVTLYSDESIVVTIRQNPEAERQKRAAREQERFQAKLQRISRMVEVDQRGCLKKTMRTNLKLVRMMNKHQKTTRDMFWGLTKTLEHQAYMAREGLLPTQDAAQRARALEGTSVDASDSSEAMETDVTDTEEEMETV